MTYQKIKACPECGSDCMSVYGYDSGWRYVECDGCWYRGPGEGSIGAAIKSHNASVAPQPELAPENSAAS